MSIEKLLEAHTKQDAENFNKIDERLESMDEKLDRLEKIITKYQGFLGGIIFIVTALVTGVSLFGQQVFAWFRG